MNMHYIYSTIDTSENRLHSNYYDIITIKIVRKGRNFYDSYISSTVKS